ncbi:TetR/AcrR family transcriptional regulator [Paenibacillus sp. LHD-117]|uniref:TetR/AcrR family transcriptional regulator n=1 Tax=Paenibacillus sp. LHD-117 TaxID=3071412 RepID=UPI0027E03CB0|nr:TetR/AcrR family transcriptional regulator [Paenibacillus sp. LHD-117]MDQ6423452.1 TetR/AcrR family transcriptional regulator [Paenibacillus sp. LHD-117]
MKQEERREQTKRLLLETTKELVREKSCPSITMMDIMDRSGLSKGAIFHYVKSKDEIFVWLLQERLEETNEQFMLEVEQGRRTFDAPMQKITESLLAYANAQDITNKILMYLLGKEDDPIIAEALKQYYERSVLLSRQWIEMGKQYGVIPESVDAGKTADLFVMMTFGLRVRSSIPFVTSDFQAQDVSSFMIDILQSR